MPEATQPTTRTLASVCPYCGVGCGMLLETDGQQVLKVSGNKQHPANFGRLCTKGASSAQALTQSGRMESAFVRDQREREPVQADMDTAIRATARRLRRILDQHGPDALAFYVSGQMSMEAQYLINKLAKGYVRTNNIESNSRLCMASAGAGYKLSLGADAPPGSYQDFDQADLFFVIGANMADCHPILFLRLMDRVKAGARLIVVDPRRTLTAEKAHLFLPIKPGTDLALLNGLLFLLHQSGKVDAEFIARYTSGWETMPEFLADYTPEKVSDITGLDMASIRQAAEMISDAQAFMTCWTMGLNQSTHGTWNTNAICNLHLATGKICRPGSGPFSLTGQPNAMGGREMGYMGPGLPGQRSLLVEKDRTFVEQLWGIAPGSISTRVGKGTVDMFERMAAGDIKACWIICTNPVATVPNRKVVIDALQKAELVITQDAFLDTETNRYADILLPGALWAEAEGIMINSERNITLMQKAVEPPGEALPDWQIIARVACEMGFEQGFCFESAEAVFDEIKRSYNPDTGYDLRGVSYARLRTTPVQWPCADADGSDRNPIRYRNDGISQPLKKAEDGSLPTWVFATQSGKAQFFPRPHVLPEEMPDGDFPFVLNTGRLQHQWHTLTKTGKIATLNKLNPGPFVEIHPEDAAERGIGTKDKVEIRSRRGYAVLPAMVTDRVQPGNCFAPFHWNDLYGENLAINTVTSDRVDAISRQPELKVAAVALTRVELIATDTEAGGSVQRIADANAPVFAVPAEETCMTLINTLAEQLDLSTAPPVLDECARTYLGGYLSGLRASLEQFEGVPTLPADAPLMKTQRIWVNGMLAGMFSRSLPVGVEEISANNGPPLIVLWASQTGNAENLVQSFVAPLQAGGWVVQVHAMNDYPLEKLMADQKVLFVTSTFGDGDAPDNGGDFWRSLQSASAPRLEKLEFALLALGDSSYDQFCGYGKKLFNRLQALGAKSLLARMDCDTDFDEPAREWLEQVKLALVAGKRPVTVGTRLLAEQKPVHAVEGHNKTHPYPARLVINQALSGEGSGKDVRCLGFDLGESNVTYQAGDALGIWPRNCPELVAELMQVLKFTPNFPVQVASQEKSLGSALLEDYEICRLHPDLLQWIAVRSGSEALRARLTALDKKALQAWLWGKQLVDVLLMFPVRCSPEELLQQLKPLQPRLYSIASSAKVHARHVQLTVSAVRYPRYDSKGTLRKGVASCFLADRAADKDVPLFVQPSKHFHVPEDGNVPLIMVGPGTGIAPFRGFLHERQARGDRGKNWLFFGEQHSATDFYYQDELTQFQKEGVLTALSVAFSRDQAQKIYVQDRMREQGKELWAWLEAGACFCVCGDASRMAKDVDQALRDIIQQQGGLGEEDAGDYVRRLSAEKRYLRDVY